MTTASGTRQVTSVPAPGVAQAAVVPTRAGAPQPMTRASRGTPRFLRWLQTVAVAVCVACGIALVTSLTIAYGQVALAGRLNTSLASAEQAAAKLNAVDIAATGWAADPSAANKSALTSALHDLGPELAGLQTDGGPTSKDVVNGVLDYAMLVQTGLDASQPAAAVRQIVAAHEALGKTVRPALSAFVGDAEQAREVALSTRSTLLADIATGAAVLVLLLLGIALARRTRRLLNFGLALSVLLLIGSWLGVTAAAGAQPMRDAVAEATASDLPTVRAETALAMASQNLTLALKDPSSTYAGDTEIRLNRAATLLANVENATLNDQIASLRRATRTVGAAVTKGDWTLAATSAKTSASAYTKFEGTLTSVEGRLATGPSTAASNAQAWLLTAGVGATLAALVAAAAAALGINQRLREYR